MVDVELIANALQASAALGMAGGAAYIGAHGFLRVRHIHLQSMADYHIKQAEAHKLEAEAQAIELQSMIARTEQGGTATIFNKAGVIREGEINRNVPNHVSVHGGTNARDVAPLIGTQPEPYATLVPNNVNLLDSLDEMKASGLIRSERLDLLMGISADKALILPLHLAMHIGGCGTTGTGKSSIDRAALVQLMMHDPKAERVRFCLIDFEGRELPCFKAAPHTWRYCEDGAEASAAIGYLHGLMQQRAKAGEAFVSRQKYMVVAIEELMDVLADLTDEAGAQLNELYRKGRKCRIYVLSASQFFQAAEVGRVIKGMVRTKLMFYHNDDTVRAFGFKPSEVAPLQGMAGRFAYEMRLTEDGPFERGTAQAPWITIADVEQLVAAQAMPASKGYTRPRSHQPTRPPHQQTIIINGSAAHEAERLPEPMDAKVQRAMLYWQPGITKAELMRRAKCSEGTAAEAIRQCKRMQNEGTN